MPKCGIISRNGGNMEKIKIYFDSDGVVFDTINKARKLGKKTGYDVESFGGLREYFISNDCDWLRLIATSGIINDAINKIKIIKEDEDVEVEILTKLCSHPHEPHIKRYVYSNLLPGVRVNMLSLDENKNDVVDSPVDCILIDDDIGNIMRWREAGGIGILFCKDRCDLGNDIIDDLLKYRDTKSVRDLLNKRNNLVGNKQLIKTRQS